MDHPFPSELCFFRHLFPCPIPALQDIKEESTSDGTENVEESRHSVARSLSGRLVRQLSQQVESVRGMKLGQFPPGAAQGQQQGTFHAAALPPEEEAEQKQQRSGNNSDADES